MRGMELSYREMLERAYERLPKQVEAYERFTIPRPEVVFVGRRTIIQNFSEIAESLRRDPDHILKFLTAEMATLATFDGSRAIFKGKFNLESIRNLLEMYTEKYVICPVCRRPDTRLERQKRLWFLQCEACGARSSVGTS